MNIEKRTISSVLDKEYRDYSMYVAENRALPSVIDGLKTGYTDKAGYCLTATMNKNNMRLISVVMKSSSKDNRSSDTIGMMEYGYSMYGSEVIFKKSEYTGKINISGSENKEYNYWN